MDSAKNRHDASETNGNSIKPLRYHSEWAMWKLDILGAAEKIAGADRGMVQAMIAFAQKVPEVPPVAVLYDLTQ
jgi:hypothetical protein